MKTALLIFVVALSLARYASASGAPEVNITTTDEGVRYHLKDINHGTEKHVKTTEEVEAWLRDVFDDKEQGNIILIFPDDRTSFRTVSDLLRRAKAAGVKQFAVTSYESTDAEQTWHAVTGQTDKLRSGTRAARKRAK